jgi:hypothetical protein
MAASVISTGSPRSVSRATPSLKVLGDEVDKDKTPTMKVNVSQQPTILLHTRAYFHQTSSYQRSASSKGQSPSNLQKDGLYAVKRQDKVGVCLLQSSNLWPNSA